MSQHISFLINNSWACWAAEGNGSIVEANNGINWINETMIDAIQCHFLYFRQTK